MSKNEIDTIPKLDWRYSKEWGACLFAGYMILAVLPVILGYALAEPDTTYGPITTLVILGEICGLTGFSILALQVALAGRFKFIDQPFGLDQAMWFHKLMAIVGGVLLLLHPVFFAVNARSMILFIGEVSWKVQIARIALVLLIATVVSSLLLKQLHFQYQVWRFLHKSVVFILILGFIHSILIGHQIYNTFAMQVYWWALFAIVTLIFMYRNLYVPAWGRRKFKVSSVEQATYDTYTLKLEPEDDKPLVHHPGQFMFIKLKRPGRKSEQHPFTIASSPTGEMPLTVTIKKSGDFTNSISETVSGDKALIEAPFGRFSFLHDNPQKFIFIAGGVGVTPIMSMLRYLRDTGDKRKALLIYGNKTEKDIIFRDELEKMSDWLKIVYIMSAPDQQWKGARGYITGEFLKKNAGDMLTDAHVYLCGPPIMMTKVSAELRSLGMPNERIHFEFFSI